MSLFATPCICQILEPDDYDLCSAEVHDTRPLEEKQHPDHCLCDRCVCPTKAERKSSCDCKGCVRDRKNS